MSGYLAPLQAGLYAHLTALSPAPAGGRIYEDVPENVTRPYISIGASISSPDDVTLSAGGDDDGESTFFDLHVWTDDPSKHQAAAILDELRAALHGVDIAASVAGRVSALCWERGARIENDPDGIRRHGVLQIEIVHRS